MENPERNLWIRINKGKNDSKKNILNRV